MYQPSDLQNMIARNQEQNEAPFDAYVFPGGYPLYYVCADNGILCPKCANENRELTLDPDADQWHIVAMDVNWEDASLQCDHCHELIESAYNKELSDD